MPARLLFFSTYGGTCRCYDAEVWARFSLASARLVSCRLFCTLAATRKTYIFKGTAVLQQDLHYRELLPFYLVFHMPQ